MNEERERERERERETDELCITAGAMSFPHFLEIVRWLSALAVVVRYVHENFWLLGSTPVIYLCG